MPADGPSRDHAASRPAPVVFESPETESNQTAQPASQPAMPKLFLWPVVMLALWTGSVSAGELVRPLEVRKVFSNGKHNAFTAMRRFKGNLYLAFRSGDSHNSATADVLVLRSPDGKAWEQVWKVDAAKDDRDPQMLATDDRLLLYCPAMNGTALDTWLTETTDGTAWSPPVKVHEPQFILWKPCPHDGAFYATAHKKDETSGGKGREVHLIRSGDGVRWEKVSLIRAGNWESETTLHFGEEGRAIVFLRQKYGSPQAQILESAPPYTEWTARDAGLPHFSGHSVHVFDGVTYLLSRFFGPDKKAGALIYLYEDGKLTPYCHLPSGGDCAYLEAVRDGANMLVSYYSTHEGSTDIYLAEVPLKRSAAMAEPPTR